MKFTDWTGLSADFLTLIGGIILALDAMSAVAHFQNENLRLKTLKSFVGKVRLETEDHSPIRNENDVHLHALRRVAFWAKIGSAVLIIGYVLQLITRLSDIFTK